MYAIMERRFDMSDFEQSLKDYADQFKIMPSKRTWNGIYNHLHPGSKWPSITVAIIFILTLISIGNLNNSPHRFKKAALISSPSSASAGSTEKPEAKGTSLAKKDTESVPLRKENPAGQTSRQFAANVNSPLISPIGNEPWKTTGNSIKNDNSSLNSKTVSSKTIPSYSFNNPGAQHPTAEANSLVNGQITGILNSEENDNLILFPVETALLTNDPTTTFDFQVMNTEKIYVVPDKESFSMDLRNNGLKTSETINFNSKSGNKNVASKKIPAKKKHKTSWLYYLEPTLNFATFHSKNIDPSSLLNTSSIVVLTNQSPFKLIRKSRPGFEAGVEMGFPVLKRLRIIGGLDISYAAFSNISNLVHPTFASLVLTDNSGNLYTKNYITHYGNGESQSQFPLVNYRFETGIPVGLQFIAWKNDKLEIDINSVVEPTFVLRSDAYTISSDGRNYVNDPDLIRKVNLDGKFGTYLSFYSKNIKWHIGPDIRYQMFSSYKDFYPTQEHFVNYGIRIGISR